MTVRHDHCCMGSQGTLTSQRESQPKVVPIGVAVARRTLTMPANACSVWQPEFPIEECALQGSAATGDGALTQAFERLQRHGQHGPIGPATLNLDIPERHAVLAAPTASALGSKPLQTLFQALEAYKASAP